MGALGPSLTLVLGPTAVGGTDPGVRVNTYVLFSCMGGGTTIFERSLPLSLSFQASAGGALLEAPAITMPLPPPRALRGPSR